MNMLLVFIGGGFGAGLRYGINVGVGRLMGSTFPWATLFINIIGCFIMGALTQAMISRLQISAELRLFLTTGILGGFTTFSAFALDFINLTQRHEMELALGYVLACVGLSILACYMGLVLVRSIPS